LSSDFFLIVSQNQQSTTTRMFIIKRILE
jgi:hypothetical protein